MKTDLELEDALRETFGVYADTVTDGPVWHGAEAVTPAVPALTLADTAPRFETPDAPSSETVPGPRPHREKTRRWQIPLIAAASVAAVALATAVLAPRVAHWTADHAADGGGTAATADVTTGTDGSTLPAVAATVDADGGITVTAGQPGLALDLYTDALCPICGDFEQTYGTAVEQAVADGQLAVRYRFVDFLNAASASGDYSTRAYAALLTVARDDEPGVFLRFYAALFDPANQPEENAAADLSNSELAALAGSVGASAAAQQDIVSGTAVAEAHTLASAALNSLRAVAETVGRSPGTPTVAVDGTPVATQSPDWLTTLLARSSG